jgi:RNA polymerase sigma factor (sigma-70 family)
MISVEQRLEEMEPTIKSLAKYNKITNYDSEDLKQDLRLLCFQLHTRFDETRNVKFKTYFIASAKNLIKKLHSKYNIEKSFIAFNDINSMGEEIVENFPSEENDYDDLVLKDIIDYLNTLPMGFLTIEYYLNELTQEELANKYNISQQGVAKNLKNNTELVKNYIKSRL